MHKLGHRLLLLSFAGSLGGCLMEEGEPNHPTVRSSQPALTVDASLLDTGVQILSSAKPSHLPCDVDGLIRTRCASCHSPSTLPHRPISLLSYEELLLPSASMPSQTYAQRAALLLESGMMPPTAALPAAEVQVFSNWIRAGAPSGDCSQDAGAQDAGTVVDAHAELPEAAIADATTGDAAIIEAGTGAAGGTHCTSGNYWRNGEIRSPLMHPGRACIACHTAGTGFLNLQHGPSFSAAGTVYPTAHEPDDCNGASSSDIKILIVDANAQRLTLTPNGAGNFTTLTRYASPFHAEIQYQGRSRAALMPHQNGDCNVCHNERGAQGTAGRLTLP